MIRGRKDCRGGQACEPTTIAEALHCLIEHSTQTVGELAAALGAADLNGSRAYLYELANPHRPERGLRALAIASALTTITQRAVVLRFLCRANGGEFVQLPPAVTTNDAGAARLAAETLREFSEAMQAFADGAADGTWSPEEVERLERDGRDAIERILQTIAHAKRAQLPARAERMVRAAARPSVRVAEGGR